MKNNFSYLIRAFRVPGQAFWFMQRPGHFSALCHQHLSRLSRPDVIVYLDDILILSSSKDDHRRHVRNVLTWLQQHGLYAKPEKCEIELQSIQFLGLIISIEGIKMDLQKVTAILDWPAPADKKGVQRFIGFANFYWKFIRGFSAIIAPITELTRQGI